MLCSTNWGQATPYRLWFSGNSLLVKQVALAAIVLLVISIWIRHGRRVKNLGKRHVFALFIGVSLLILTMTLCGVRNGVLIKPTYKLSNGGKVIALTFDDGSNSHTTPTILEILSHNDLHATFFVVGQRVKQHPEIVRRIIDEGHAVGNHSFSHKNLAWASPATVRSEIERCEEELYRVGIATTRLFRSPEGARSLLLESYLREHEYQLVTWSYSPKDWKSPSADEPYSRMVKGIKPLDIVLLHDISNTAIVLDKFINTMRSRGYVFITMVEPVSSVQADTFELNHRKN